MAHFKRFLFSLFLLVIFSQESISGERIDNQSSFSRSLSRQGYLPLVVDDPFEGNLREEITGKLSPGLCTKAKLYPLHNQFEQNVREILRIISSEVDEREKIQTLNRLVQRALPTLLQELSIPLNSDDLLGLLGGDVSQQQLLEHFELRKQGERVLLQKAQAKIILKALSDVMAGIDEVERDDVVDFNVFSTTHSDKLREVERVLKTSNIESLDDFGQAIDRGVFANVSKRVFLSSLPFGLIGLIPSSPSCGYLMVNAATFMGIPPDHPSASAMIAYILVATTPAFVRQFYDLGKSLTTSWFKEVPFTKKKNETGVKPYRFQRNIFHKCVNAVLVGNAFVTALFPTLLMKRAEIQFPVFFGLTVAPFFVAWFDNAIQGGIINADRIFTRYFYTTPQTELIKETLRHELKTFLAECKKNKDLTRRVSMEIEQQKTSGFQRGEDNPFLFSCFFVKSISQSTAYLPEIDIQKPVMSKDTALWLSTILTGMGSYGRYILFQNVFEELLGSVGFSSQWTTGISIALSLGETLYRNMCSYAQEEFFLNGANIFSSEKNLTVWRKAASALSCISGLLFSIPGLVAGFSILSNYSTLDKVVILIPAFLLDYSSYQPFFKIYYDSIINDLATKFSCSSTNQLATIVQYAEKVDDFIVHADVPTTSTLWEIMKANGPHEHLVPAARELNGG